MDCLAQLDLSTRNKERMQLVMDALNATFAWKLPVGGLVSWAGVRGGHANVHFAVTGSPAYFRAKAAVDQDRLFPPGIRLPLRLPDARFTWALHLPEVSVGLNSVAGRAHIDRADPDADLVGVAEHVGWDFLFGRFKKDLDPKRY